MFVRRRGSSIRSASASLRLVLGGSIGGMQALDWTILQPDRVERALIIGVTPLSAMGLALNHLQRQAIQHDPEWAGAAICRSALRAAGWRWPARSP